MTELDEPEQEALDLRVIREARGDADDSTIHRQPTLLSAIHLCINVSGLSSSQVASELKIQEAQFSRILTGKAHFPPNKIDALMDLCGNEIPLRWQSLRRGYGLVRLKSAVEADLQVEREENARLRMKLQHWEEFQKISAK